MLGCHDFCGYYDWTFRHVAEHHGTEAVKDLWADAIGGESQSHYLQAALQAGLRGLYHTWVKTGEDESCDWTFTLDEQRNVLRWDMRRCPSKGLLLQNDLNAHDDYCDHCMGWIVPLLAKAGVEIVTHEHNHCGQCWAEMSVRGVPRQPLHVARDIRDDPTWRHGYLDRWDCGDQTSESFVAALEQLFAGEERLTLVTSAPSRVEASGTSGGTVIVAGAAYPDYAGDGCAVLIDAPPAELPRIANRFLTTSPKRRPALLYTYFPSLEPVDFLSLGLGRPMPILPLLITRGVYRHRPHHALPSTQELLSMLATALRKQAIVH